MNVNVTSRHFTASQSLKILVHEKIKKIEKFNNGIINCQVILSKENKNENVEIIIHLKGYDCVACDNSETFENSLTNAVEKMIIQLKKYLGKIKSR